MWKYHMPQITFLESNYSKILRQTENITFNRISVKVHSFQTYFQIKQKKKVGNFRATK